MKKVIVLILVISFISCEQNIDNRINNYIDCNCDFTNNKDCIIDMREVLSIDYDAMYLFDGYDIPESVPLIVEGKEIELKGGYIYGSEKDKIIFLLNNKIIYEAGLEHNNIYIGDGKIIEKYGIFDGDSMIVSAMLYSSPFFKVTKDNNSYFLENIYTNKSSIVSELKF